MDWKKIAPRNWLPLIVAFILMGILELPAVLASSDCAASKKRGGTPMKRRFRVLGQRRNTRAC